jgi:hypothetical protein
MQNRSLALAFGVLALTSCGGGGDGITTVCSPAPSISSSPPTSATVGQQYRYVIAAAHECGTFLPMVCSDVQAQLLPAGATLYEGPPYITWIPSASQANSNVSFRVATAADACGNQASQAWTVRVAADVTAPQVTAVSPADQATGVSTTGNLYVSFSEPVDPTTVTASSFLVSGPAGPIAGSVAVGSGSGFADFVPGAALPAGSLITATVTTAVRDPSGNAIAAPYSWSFTTTSSGNASGWALTTLDNSADVQWTSIALDSGDQEWVAYQDGMWVGSNQQKGTVLVSGNAVDTVTPVVYSSIAATVNTDDVAHVAYFDFGNSRLRHAVRSAGTWVTETVDPNAQNVSTVAMGHDALGRLHIVYNANAKLRHALLANKAWTIETLAIDANPYGDAATHAVAADPTGSLHIAYYDSATHSLRHASNESGAWTTESIDGGGDVGLHVSLAVDPAGRLHASYYDATNGDLKYATNATGTWIARTLDAPGDVGTGTAIAVDASGKVHISYTDGTQHTLKYATDGSGQWIVVPVDFGSYVGGVYSTSGYTSIAIDSLGGVHIVYRGNAHLMHALHP